MSLLPQRKKSPAEIAHLRESLGLPAVLAAPEATDLPVPPAVAAALSPRQPTENPVVPVLKPKIVRSLRKSEQFSQPGMRPRQVPTESNLPIHRHSDDELNDIRRREALAMLTPVVNVKLALAHPAWVVSGYVAALASAVSAAWPAIAAPSTDSRPLTLPVCCAVVALIVAAVIVFSRPLSRHHAAFITVITWFVIIFGALYYFPNLRHAT